jgi:hypothetical protein
VHSIAIQERKPGGHDHGNPGKGYGMIGIQWFSRQCRHDHENLGKDMAWLVRHDIHDIISWKSR